MHSYAKKVISSFKKIVSDLVAQKSSLNLVSNAFVDFTRNRKLSFCNMLSMIVFMSAKPIKEELFDYFDTASTSAFVQARDKILPDAFESLFHNVNDSFPLAKTYRGYHLNAVVGSDLPTSYDPSDTNTLKCNGDSHRGNNQFHINAVFDILNNRYIDAIINGVTHSGEQESMWKMVERHKGNKTIFNADIAYATLNNMEHINHSGHFFLIRAKDIFSNGFLKKFNLPNEEFDMFVESILTAKQNKQVKENPDNYRLYR